MAASRRRLVPVFPLLAALLYPHAAGAQGWVRLPNGELGYITDYTTTGFFRCGNPVYLIGTCQASGNSITLGSGGNTMTLAFHGLSQVITATNVGQSVNMGTVTKSFGGNGPFLFPTSKHAAQPLFFFSIVLNTSFPLAGSGTWSAGYLPLSRTTIPPSCCNLRNYVQFPTTAPPEGFTYGAVQYSKFLGSTMTVTGEPLNLTATVGILPEPATIWLTASGLVGVFAAVRRRRRR